MRAADADRVAEIAIIQSIDRGSRLDEGRIMRVCYDPEIFPCPFCNSRAPFVIGANRTFLHYRCADCSEIWTATRFPPIGSLAGTDVVVVLPKTPPLS